MGVNVSIMDIEDAKKRVSEYIGQLVQKSSEAVIELECEDYRDTMLVMMVLRELHPELLEKKIFPVVRLTTGMNQIDAIETALLMKGFALATEKLQKFHPKIKLVDLRATINNEALDSFKGKTREEISQELKDSFPETKKMI